MKLIFNISFIFLLSLLNIYHSSDGGLIQSLRTNADVTDVELADLSELLLSKDEPNLQGRVSLRVQNKVYTNIPSSGPLLEYLTTDSTAREPQTYTLLRQLFRAYERGADPTRAKNAFLNAIIETDVMKETIDFLNQHGIRMDKASLKRFLDVIWFTSYHRGQGIQSSGFQHVFMAEIKNNEVKGLHNWLFYLDQQNQNLLRYIGYSKSLQFKGYPSGIVKIRYQWRGVDKPSGSMFVSTSPELEMALYSICFLYRSQKDCNLKLGTININIKTHKFDIRGGEQVIGSAYPTV